MPHVGHWVHIDDLNGMLDLISRHSGLVSWVFFSVLLYYTMYYIILAILVSHCVLTQSRHWALSTHWDKTILFTYGVFLPMSMLFQTEHLALNQHE